MDLKSIYTEVLESELFCDQCEYSCFYNESRPYGEGSVTERLWQCTVNEIKDCPGVIEHLQEEKDNG